MTMYHILTKHIPIRAQNRFHLISFLTSRQAKIHIDFKKATTLRRVLVLNAGGTITMTMTKHGLTNVDGYFQNLLKTRYPMVKDGFVTNDTFFKYEELHPLKDSSQAKFADFIRIIDRIKEDYFDYDGFVILHGTDTLAYAACFAYYFITFPSLPIIFTGSINPISIDEKNWLNIEGSILTTIPGVLIYMNKKVLLPIHTHKLYTDMEKSFISNSKQGDLQNYAIRNHMNMRQKTQFYSKYAELITVIRMHPNLDEKIFQYLIKFQCDSN